MPLSTGVALGVPGVFKNGLDKSFSVSPLNLYFAQQSYKKKIQLISGLKVDVNPKKKTKKKTF